MTCVEAREALDHHRVLHGHWLRVGSPIGAALSIIIHRGGGSRGSYDLRTPAMHVWMFRREAVTGANTTEYE